MTFRLHGFHVLPHWLHHHQFPRANKQFRAAALRIQTVYIPKPLTALVACFPHRHFTNAPRCGAKPMIPTASPMVRHFGLTETARPMGISGHVTAHIRHANPSSRRRGNKTPHLSPVHPVHAFCGFVSLFPSPAR